MDKKRIMVLCTGNSCRSQMAEGYLRTLSHGEVEAMSAGVMETALNRRAVAVMAEDGVDISGQRSKAMDPELLKRMDMVITVCGNAEATCPVLPPGVRRLHIPIDDPVGAIGTEEEIMAEFRRARDEIRGKMKEVLEGLGLRKD